MIQLFSEEFLTSVLYKLDKLCATIQITVLVAKRVFDHCG